MSMNYRPQTAVILASGYGGRRMPIVSVLQKEMIPILNRPTIDYIVADCVNAGIDRIIFVVRPDNHQIKDYYTHLSFLSEMYKYIRFEFVERLEEHGNGTASALKAAVPLLRAEERFVVCAGDGFMCGERQSYIEGLIDKFCEENADAAFLVTKCPESKLFKYGVLNQEGKEPIIIEKPAPGEAPSSLINVSNYVFKKDFIPFIENLEAIDGEYRLTDAINSYGESHDVWAVGVRGFFLDAGDVSGWLNANRVLESYETSSVLVVGGDGFIGSHVVDGQPWDVLDLKRGQDVRQGIDKQYSTIIFLATDISQTQEAYDYNESLYKALDEYMQKYPDTHVIYSSSAAVYPDRTVPQEEITIPDPPSIYGRGKLLGEVYVQRYRRHTIFRFSNVYGSGEGNGVIDQFIRGIKPVTADDATVRDYVPVQQVVQCIRQAVKYPELWHGITNVSSNTGMTVRQVWEMVKGDEPFASEGTRKGDASYSVLDNSKMLRQLEAV